MGARPRHGLPPAREQAGYYETLRPLFARVDLWRTTYYHTLAGGASAVVEWFKGSSLRPILDALRRDEREEDLRRHRSALEVAYPAQPNGTVLLPFRRLFLVATR